MRKSQREGYHCAPAAAAGPAVMKPFVRNSPAATDAAGPCCSVPTMQPERTECAVISGHITHILPCHGPGHLRRESISILLVHRRQQGTWQSSMPLSWQPKSCTARCRAAHQAPLLVPADVEQTTPELPTRMLQLMGLLEREGRTFAPKTLVTLASCNDRGLVFQANCSTTLLEAIRCAPPCLQQAQHAKAGI